MVKNEINPSLEPAVAPMATSGSFLTRFVQWRRQRRRIFAERFAREEPLRVELFRIVIVACAGALMIQGALLFAKGVPWTELIWTTLEPGVLMAGAAWCSRRHRALLATLLLLVALSHAAAFTQAHFKNVEMLGVLLALTIPLAGMLVGATFVRAWTLICCGTMAFVVSRNVPETFSPWQAIAGWSSVYIAMAWLIELFARHFERLYEANRTAEEQRHRAIVVERTRFARDIHDTLAQGFTGIVVQLNAAEQRLPPEDTAAREHIDKARQLARESLEEARRSVFALRPESIAQGGLLNAIAQIGRKLCDPSGANVETTLTGIPCALAEHAESQLVRIAQEAMTNAVRHSGAKRIGVCVRYQTGLVVIEIEDDGRGISHKITPGLGMSGMKARAHEIGGDVRFESRPSGGTCVVVEFPHA